jgi:microcystin degradation protein MlrC
MKKIFVAGFQHETNTFAPTPADWAAFTSGTAFPRACQGAAMLEALGPTSLPMGGFIRHAHSLGLELVPSMWAGASPSAPITRDAFERIADAIVIDAARGGFDAIYLDLHGAAVAEHADDAEGELLQRLRAVVGMSIPLVASLDLHANVTERMLRLCHAYSAYRTYPHVDMAATGARCLDYLLQGAGPSWHTHARRLPFLLPLNMQTTFMEPAAGLYQRLAQAEAEHGVKLSFAMGFPAADFPECGPVLCGHGPDAARVQTVVNQWADELLARRGEWKMQLYAPDAAVQEALRLAEPATQPVLIADTQDNPGAGADSNTTGMLHALLRAGAGRRFPGQVALGLMNDSAAAQAAHSAGVGAQITLSLGRSVRTFSGEPSDAPVTHTFTVRQLSDGTFPMHGPMTAGGTAHFGPSACLEVEGVLINVVSGPCQMLDRDFFRFLGVEPETMKILVAKSSVHFRAAFAPICAEILVAKAPGPMAADPSELPWKHLPDSMARLP